MSVSRRMMQAAAGYVPVPQLQLIDSKTNSRGDSGSVSVDVPDHVDGDELFAVACYSGSFTPPAGWTNIHSYTGGANVARLMMYRRTASSEPASYSWTTTLDVAVVQFSIRGSTAYTVGTRTDGTDTSSPITCAIASTTTYTSGMLICFATVDNVSNGTSIGFTVSGYTFPTVVVTPAGINQTPCVCMAKADEATDGNSTSAGSFTISSATATTGASTITLKLE